MPVVKRYDLRLRLQRLFVRVADRLLAVDRGVRRRHRSMSRVTKVDHHSRSPVVGFAREVDLGAVSFPPGLLNRLLTLGGPTW